MIGLTKEVPEKSGGKELHRLLGTLLSNVLTNQEKQNIMKQEYHILEEQMEGVVNHMCNLGEGIWEDGIAKGVIEESVRIILNMHEKGFTDEQIAMATDKGIEEIKEIIESHLK